MTFFSQQLVSTFFNVCLPWNALNNNSKTKQEGRSPEEKVNGHRGANNREPQGHNMNNYGRGPFDDVIY